MSTRCDAAAVDEKVSAYVVAAGYQIAPPLSFVKASDVMAAARAATGIADVRDNFFNASLLRALERATSCKVVRTKAPHARSTGSEDMYWAVTCASIPAAPFETPEWNDRPIKDKKAQRTTWRRKKGIPDPDPLRSRIVGKKSAFHFTMYTDELLGLKSAPQILELRLFPSAKELTESFACFNAVREHLSDAFRPDDPSVLLVCVGDGLTPRTASLFCFRTKWKCISVDPLMRGPLGFHSDETRWSAHIERLTVRRARLQDAAPSPAGKWAGERVLLVLPHAHIALDECLEYVSWSAQLGAVVMPCCNWYLGAQGCGPPLYEEDDLGVVSPHRQVSVWKWAPGDALPPAVPPPDAPPTGETPQAAYQVPCVECE